jgi:hypothetical protein
MSYVNQDLSILNILVYNRYKKMVHKDICNSYRVKEKEYYFYEEKHNTAFIDNNLIYCWTIVEKEEYLVMFRSGDTYFWELL